MDFTNLYKEKTKEVNFSAVTGMLGYGALNGLIGFISSGEKGILALGCGAAIGYFQCKKSIKKKLAQQIDKVKNITNESMGEMYGIERKNYLTHSTCAGFLFAWGMKSTYDGAVMNSSVYLAFGSFLLFLGAKMAYKSYQNANRISVNENEIIGYLKDDAQNQR